MQTMIDVTEDTKWGELAKKASEKGFLSKKSSKKWFEKMQGRLTQEINFLLENWSYYASIGWKMVIVKHYPPTGPGWEKIAR